MDTHARSSCAEAWLTWFQQHKALQVRAGLCSRYGLDSLDAEALINTAQLQVFRRWDTLTNPMAYMWQTLKHAVWKQGQRRRREQQRMAVYARQQQHYAHHATRTTEQVATVLALLAGRQQRLLEWYAQGWPDAQVAAWLQTTPQAVRVARHEAYRALRARLCPSGKHCLTSSRKHRKPFRKNAPLASTTHLA